jgi:hypothetical protein
VDLDLPAAVAVDFEAVGQHQHYFRRPWKEAGRPVDPCLRSCSCVEEEEEEVVATCRMVVVEEGRDTDTSCS